MEQQKIKRTYSIFETSIFAHSEGFKSNNFEHYGVFHRIMNYLTDLGFAVTKDPDIEMKYKLLSKDHRYGKKKDLEFKAERYPAGFKVEFFQNVVFENRQGGYFDFDKLEKMPYLIKKEMELTMNKIGRFLNELGYENCTKPSPKTAVDKIKNSYVESWHKPQTSMDFQLSDLDGTTDVPYNSKDRDGKQLFCGQIKYYRDHKGYLARGKIYHNINNMWWMILNKQQIQNVADFELFDLSSNEKIGRQKKHRIPLEKKDTLTRIHDYTTKELIRELRLRNFKVAIKRKNVK